MAERKDIATLVEECFAEPCFSVRQITQAVLAAGYGGHELVAVARQVHHRIWTEIGEAQSVFLVAESDRIALFEHIVNEMASPERLPSSSGKPPRGRKGSRHRGVT